MEKEYTGKTRQEAIETAVRDLNVPQEELHIETLEVGAKGFLGIGAKDARIKVTYQPDPHVVARNYLEGLFEKIGVDAAIDITTEDDTLMVQVTGEEADCLLKNRGESVDALQLLLSLVISHTCGAYYKLSFNVNDYKEKTKERLEALALKTAGQVVRNRRKTTLPPMTSFQRRIIHAKLQDYKDVTTYSVGEEPARRVVVSYCGADGPAPRRDNGNNRDRRGNGGKRYGGGRKGGYNGNRKPYDRDRAPRREYEPEGEVYTGAITHLPGEKLSGSAAKKAEETTVITGGTPFTME